MAKFDENINLYIQEAQKHKIGLNEKHPNLDTSESNSQKPEKKTESLKQ